MTLEEIKTMYEKNYTVLTFEFNGKLEDLEIVADKMYVTKITDDRFKVVAYSGNTKMRMIVRRAR